MAKTNSSSLVPFQMIAVTERTNNFVFGMMRRLENGEKISKLSMRRMRNKYQRLRRLEFLLFNAMEDGSKSFNWKKAHEAGKLCKYDYELFRELKKFSWKDWGKKV